MIGMGINLFTRRVGGAFSPASIAGLEAWFTSSDQANYSSTSDDNGWTKALQWDDSSGNGNHATQILADAPYIEGSALYFNDTTLNLSDLEVGTDNFTIFGSFSLLDQVLGTNKVFLDARSSAGSLIGFWLRTSTTKGFEAVFDFGAVNINVSISEVLTFGKFYTFCFSVNRAGNAVLYLYDSEGTLLETATEDISIHPATSLTSGQDWILAGYDTADTFDFISYIREVGFYRTNIDAAQAQQIANYVATTYPELAPDAHELSSYQYTWYNGENVTKDGTDVIGATDLFGTHNLAEASLASRPTVGSGLNGYDTIDFSTHPDSTLIKENITEPRMLSAVIVAKTVADSFTTFKALFGVGLSFRTGNGRWEAATFQNGSNRIVFGAEDGTNLGVSDDFATTEQWRVYTVKAQPRDNGYSVMVLGYAELDGDNRLATGERLGTGDGYIDTFATGDGDDIAIGARNGRGSFNGEVAEVVVFDSVDGNFGGADLLRVRQHLLKKYGL